MDSRSACCAFAAADPNADPLASAASAKPQAVNLLLFMSLSQKTWQLIASRRRCTCLQHPIASRASENADCDPNIAE
jgi:hypothetical protein